MEISQFAYIPLLLMLFSVLAVVRGWPENTFMLFKKHLDHFFQLEITTKKGMKRVYPGILEVWLGDSLFCRCFGQMGGVLWFPKDFSM